MNIFISYHLGDEHYVRRLTYSLKKQPELVAYCYGAEQRSNPFRDQLVRALEASEAFVFIVGEKIGDYQLKEARAVDSSPKPNGLNPQLLVVKLPGAAELPVDLFDLRQCDPIIDAGTPQETARQIVIRLGLLWIPEDGLPIGYPFDYEKAIIEAYAHGNGRLEDKNLLERGCPVEWPTLLKEDAVIPNPVDQAAIGTWRGDNQKVLVDARVQYAVPERNLDSGSRSNTRLLTFPEAGPRELVRYARNAELTVGIVVSGGIAPGINAVIAGIVERHELYHKAHANKSSQEGRIGYKLKICGFRDGFSGLLRHGHNYRTLCLDDIREHANAGGSMLGTSRAPDLLSLADDVNRDAECPLEIDTNQEPVVLSGMAGKRDRLLERIVQNLHAAGVEILYVVGGDGSMRAAHAIWSMGRQLKQDSRIEREISVVGIPKTMDNDILWVWQSFGFLSAVEEAKEAILKLHTEAKSNPRLCVIQLFGSDSGFVVSHAALASGVCDAALIPEIPFSMTRLSDHILQRLQARYKPGEGGSSPYGVIVMAEAALPVDAASYLDDREVGLDDGEKCAVKKYLANNRRVQGQTPDELRSAGLKIVSRVLQRDIRSMPDYWADFRVFTNEPRHLIRAITPSVADVIFGQRLGSLAVDNAMAGYTDFMISQWLTEYVLVPLKLVVLGRKRVPPGIFWKSVLSSTGQPMQLEVGPIAHETECEK